MIYPWHKIIVVLLVSVSIKVHAQLQPPSATDVIASLVTAPKISKIYKSDNDTRNYRYITLNNNLRVLLVSDAKAEKSAAALNIHVGSHQDPKNRLGLAHFLEHMLFLGTEKYPAAGEFQDFISQHGGDNNAYTADEYTNYYFDVEHVYFEPALDRFAQFFIAPSFDASNVEREKNAVNAEYLASINNDEHREWDVLKSFVNSDHPASNFSVGSLETLADQEGHSVRDDLVAFYQNYYSANLMTLVVLSNQKLDDMQKLVETRFTQIVNKNKVISAARAPLFVEGVLPLSVNIKPVKELRQLSLLFPVPSYSAQYQSKPWDYLAHMLGDEGAGSLLSLLKSTGWAESLEAGEFYRDRQTSLFQISLSLTKDGLKAKDQVIAAVFDYIKLVSGRGINDWRFNEMRQLAELDFRFHEKQTALDSVTELAQAMQDYAAQDTLLGRYAYAQYDEDLLKKAAAYLRKDNVLIATIAPEVSAQSTSSFYQVPFSSSAGIGEVAELKSAYHQKLVLPDHNIFIPKNTAVKTVSMLSSQDAPASGSVPNLLSDTDQLQLWFLQDTQYRSPKAELNLRFKLPALNNSLENSARAQLFAALIMDQLNEYAYPAKLAGLTYDMTANSRGFDINVAGYTDKQSLLVNKIVDAIAAPNFQQNRFEKLKDDLIRQWRNEDKNAPYTVLAQKVLRLQFLPFWGARELAEALQPVSFEQFKGFANEVLRGAKVDALFYGNMYPQDAIKLSALVDHQLLQKKSGKLPQLAKALRVDNKNNKSWLYTQPLDHSDHSLELYIQALSPGADDAAHMMLLTQMLQPLFYNQLRTEKQLGYVVTVTPMLIRNLEASLFVIQSPSATAETLLVEINNFLASAPASFGDSFSENKKSLIAQLREPQVSLHDQFEQYWQSILLGDTKFSRQQELISAANKITLESLTKYYEAVFLQKNHRLWLSTDKIDPGKDFELIQNVADYQQKMQGYLYP